MKNLEGLLFFVGMIAGSGILILLFASLFSKRRRAMKFKVVKKLKNVRFISFNVFLLGFNIFLLMLFPWIMFYPKSENQQIMLIIFCYLVLMMMVVFLLIYVDKKEVKRSGS